MKKPQWAYGVNLVAARSRKARSRPWALVSGALVLLGLLLGDPLWERWHLQRQLNAFDASPLPVSAMAREELPAVFSGDATLVEGQELFATGMVMGVAGLQWLLETFVGQMEGVAVREIVQSEPSHLRVQVQAEDMRSLTEYLSVLGERRGVLGVDMVSVQQRGSVTLASVHVELGGEVR